MNARGAADKVTVILAGGQSRRMGRDKALLPFGSTTLLAHVADRARALGFPVVVSTAPGRLYDLPSSVMLIEDTYAGGGPLGGILSVMRAVEAAHYLFWPVDMPRLDARIWQMFLEASALEPHKMICARTADRIFPLPGVFPAAARLLLESHWAAGRRALYPLCATNAAKVIDLSRYSAYFVNLNSPDDLRGCNEQG